MAAEPEAPTPDDARAALAANVGAALGAMLVLVGAFALVFVHFAADATAQLAALSVAGGVALAVAAWVALPAVLAPTNTSETEVLQLPFTQPISQVLVWGALSLMVMAVIAVELGSRFADRRGWADRDATVIALGVLRGRPVAMLVGGLALFIALMVTVIDMLGATVGTGFGTLLFGVTVIGAMIVWRQQIAAFSRRDILRIILRDLPSPSRPRLTLTRTRS